MIVTFLDTKNQFETSNVIRNINKENINQLTTIQNAEVIKNTNNNEQSEIQQLQTNILNSLNYASNQNLLPSTLPKNLNIKFLNISKLEKIKDKIIPSPIAQLESPNTMYVSTDLLPQNQTDFNKSLISSLYNKSNN